MAYECPHCLKFSYAPQAFDKLDGFALICAHCNKAFAQDGKNGEKNRKNRSITGDICPIICPHCDDILHLQEAEYDILYGHELTCLTCSNSLLLPEKQPAIKIPSSASTLLKIGVLYLFILASLALIFTPQGTEFITYLGQISDTPHHYLRSFYDIWDDFLAFMQSLFI